MDKPQVLFEKHYSHLEGLQDEQCTRYMLTSVSGREGRVFGISVHEQCGDAEWQETVEPFSTSESFVRDVVAFLYERAVSATSVREVLKDILQSKVEAYAEQPNQTGDCRGQPGNV